ncbi:hypothetical protein EV121DRAFT_278190 [Schizophyllum commune]
MQIFDSRTENVMSCLIDALDDPCNPKFCAKFYVDWIHALVNADDRHAEHETKLRKNTRKMSLHGRISSHGSGHRLLEAIWAFLTTPRTFDDMRALDERMKICRCYGDDLPALAKQIHPPPTSLPSFQSALILLIEFMTNVLSLAPDVYWKSQRRVARAAERGIVVRWPPHALTLLGDDEDTTVTVICRWMAAYPSHKHTYKFFDLLSQVSRICGRAAVTVMFRCTYLPQAFANELDHWLSLVSRRTEALMPIFAVLRWWYSVTHSHGDGMTTAAFFGDEAERVLGIMEHMLRLVSWLRSLPPSIASEADTIAWIFFCGQVGFVHSALDLPYNEVRYDSWTLQRSRSARDLRSGENIYRGMHFYVSDLACLDYCGYPPCKATFTGEGRRFRYCGACKIVPYCSVECQRKHWRWERDPHRTICDDFRYLRITAGFRASHGQGSEAVDFTADEAWTRPSHGEYVSATRSISVFRKRFMEALRMRLGT